MRSICCQLSTSDRTFDRSPLTHIHAHLRPHTVGEAWQGGRGHLRSGVQGERQDDGRCCGHKENTFGVRWRGVRKHAMLIALLQVKAKVAGLYLAACMRWTPFALPHVPTQGSFHSIAGNSSTQRAGPPKRGQVSTTLLSCFDLWQAAAANYIFGQQ